LVERVTFHSPETGFCVLRVTVRGQRELVTVVGAAASIGAGEFVQALASTLVVEIGERVACRSAPTWLA
jgi:hypothetical protein